MSIYLPLTVSFIPLCCYLVSFCYNWSTLFSITYKGGLMLNFLSFCLSGKSLYFFLIYEEQFYWKFSVLVWQFFSFSAFNILFYSLLKYYSIPFWPAKFHLRNLLILGVAPFYVISFSLVAFKFLFVL